jgi:Spy/CpxP family protein refolding chaperone
MQTETFSRVVGGLVGAVIIAVGVVSFTPLTSAAQDQGATAPVAGGPRRGGPGSPGGFEGRGGRFSGPMGGPMGIGIDRRDLSDAQREQVKAIRERHAAEIKPLVEQTQAARKALHDNVLGGGTNLRALAMELGKAEGDLAFANAQIEAEMIAVLTPEQRQKMQERAKDMDARRAQMQQRRQGAK